MSPIEGHFSTQTVVMFGREKTFKMPDIRRVDEKFREPPAVERHYRVMHRAMLCDDKDTVNDRQVRLLRGRYEVPVTLKQVKAILEKYKDASETS